MTVVGYGGRQNHGARFCSKCSAPAPWLTRQDIIEWIQHKIQADPTIASPTRLELRDILERLQGMDPDDTKAVSSWQRVRDAAPKVWEATKPVRDAIIGEAVKRILLP